MLKTSFKNKLVTILILLSILLGALSPSIFAIDIDPEKIVSDLHIVNKKNDYYQGSYIMIKGSWRLPDDSAKETYYGGDSFEIKIPEGLIPDNKAIELSKYANGSFDESTRIYKFTFTDEIEGRMDRYGEFGIACQINTGDEEKKIVLDFGVSNLGELNVLVHKLEEPGNNNSNQKDGELVYKIPDKDNNGYMKPTQTGSMKWYIRVNRDAEESGEVTIKDTLSSNQILKPGSLKIIKELKVKGNSMKKSNYYIENYTEYKLEEKDNEFILTLKLDEHSGDDEYFKDLRVDTWVSFYTVEYETYYSGDVNSDTLKDENGRIKVENTVKYSLNNTSEIEYSREGLYAQSSFGTGFSREKLGRLYINKIDSVSEEVLSGAEFKLENKDYEIEKTIKSNDDGKYIIDSLPEGIYTLKESKAPEGYELDESEKTVIVKYDSSNTVTYNFKNNQEKEKNIEKIDLIINKEWIDNGDSSSRPNISIRLMNSVGEEIRSALLRNDKFSYTFKDLDKFNSEGNEIKYTVIEDEVEGYECRISENENNIIDITNTWKEEEVIPLTPLEPSKPKKETPLTPLEHSTPTKPEEKPTTTNPGNTGNDSTIDKNNDNDNDDYSYDREERPYVRPSVNEDLLAKVEKDKEIKKEVEKKEVKVEEEKVELDENLLANLEAEKEKEKEKAEKLDENLLAKAEEEKEVKNNKEETKVAKLPKTGSTSNIVVYTIGSILILASLVINKKRNN